MCDVSELDRLKIIADQEAQTRKVPERLLPYLEARRQWNRRGRQGRPPQSLDYGLMLCDVTAELSELDAQFSEPTGLSSWNFYRPEYYDRMMEIRQIADQLGLDPDAAAAEFHTASPEPWMDSPKRRAVLEDYRHAIFEKCSSTGREQYRFLLAGHEDRKAKLEAKRKTKPTLFNPYRYTGASALLTLALRSQRSNH